MPDVRPTVRQRRLGLELRQLRRENGWTLEDAAVRLERSVSALSKLETGRQRLRPRDLPFILDQYGVTDAGRREDLVGLARRAAVKNWWQEYAGVVKDPFDDYLSLENEAVAIDVFAGLLVPGVLQTEEYAYAVVEASREWQTSEQVARFVELRMARQQALFAERPMRIWAVLTEQVLRQHIGGRTVMGKQLDHLLQITTDLPHVVLQVLPYDSGAHAGLDGSFSLLRFEGSGPDVACINALTSTIHLEQDVEVGRYVTTFDYLKSIAVSPRDSLPIIRRISEEFQHEEER
jgi:transcriptional regulator with XRE-family HTH domain